MIHSFIKHVRFAGKFLLIALLTFALTILSLTPAHASRLGAERNAAVLFNVLRAKGWNVRESFSWGFLERGQSAIVRTTLYKGNTYQIVAAGCEDARDVDIAVYDENANLIDGDHDSSRLAVADITPKWTGVYYIKVTMYDSTADGAHYIVQYAHN